MQMLANNAASDPVPFVLYQYAEVACYAPPLAEGVTCLGLVRMTLDRYLAGIKGYGQVGYHRTPAEPDLANWKAPWTTLDTLPSLLSAACVYVDASRDLTWADRNYSKLADWARQMLANDRDGNGLLEYPGTGNYGDRPKLLDGEVLPIGGMPSISVMRTPMPTRWPIMRASSLRAWLTN